MKVIGTVTNETYICQVTHAELCELMNKSAYGDAGLKKLNVGDSIDLGLGYNFLQNIKKVCAEMTSASEAFHRSQSTLLKFASLMAEKPEDKE